jgi:hypothetical protein
MRERQRGRDGTRRVLIDVSPSTFAALVADGLLGHSERRALVAQSFSSGGPPKGVCPLGFCVMAANLARGIVLVRERELACPVSGSRHTN